MTLTITCARCNGEGCLPCSHGDGLGHDCSCPLWECPDCEGVGGIDEQLEAVR